jgi:hypothetical protein
MLLAYAYGGMARGEVFIDQSHEAQTLLSELTEQTQTGQWDRAAYLVEELLDKHAGDLVPIQPYRYIPVTPMLGTLAKRSTELLKILQARDASQAAAARDAAGGDPAALERVARRYNWTEAGREAGLLAAGWRLERAEFDHAARGLADIIDDAPGSNASQTQARTLAATAAIFSRDLTTLREHALRLLELSAGDELTSLKRLAESMRTIDRRPAPMRPDRRLAFDEFSGKRSQPDVLRCLSISRGPALWSLRPRELDPGWKTAEWAGRPLLIDARAYIPVRLKGPANLVQVFIAALNVDDGSLIWARRIYSCTVDRRSKHEVGLCDLTAIHESIYACVDGVALCRLGPSQGELRWITLRSGLPSESAKTEISPWIRQRVAALPAGIVMIQPGLKVTVYDPRDGQVIRRIDAEAWRNPQHLRVMGDGVMAFGDRIVRIDGRTLEPAWVSPEPFDPRSFDAEPDRDQDPGPTRTRSLRDSVGGRIDSAPLNTRVPDRRVR